MLTIYIISNSTDSAMLLRYEFISTSSSEWFHLSLMLQSGGLILLLKTAMETGKRIFGKLFNISVKWSWWQFLDVGDQKLQNRYQYVNVVTNIFCLCHHRSQSDCFSKWSSPKMKFAWHGCKKIGKKIDFWWFFEKLS